MRTSRNIIEINEEVCDGCGQCIVQCAEGALALVDGKVRLVGEVLCDGLGACIGECPTGALKVVVREADDFDKKEVVEHLHRLEAEGRTGISAASRRSGAASHVGAASGTGTTSRIGAASHTTASSRASTTPNAGHYKAAPSFGCPSARAMEIERRPARASADGFADADSGAPPASELRHWPIKLTLLRQDAPFLRGADLLLLADCVGVSYPALHGNLLRGKAVAIGCPKLDDLDEHIDKLTNVLRTSLPRSLTVAFMEVPCCRGFVYAAERAIETSGVALPLKALKIGISGEVQGEEELGAVCARCTS